ncbi:MAG TPA: DsrE/DsrF/DrsH-like family protein [Caldisericia bacterium]|jgi:peroxiredoxin family protein|nr:MAG: DsrE/DsrF-like family protein [bacterium ADurb.Bin132]HNY61541.1 DsrE/DsrF/DrsH-like family protein [Caldisericia bacterium]HOC79224.1 DsrE/DsrF/DrsH-like family protein [Caldisericia bacterium]HOG70525.1 DsrE/DsrF/DrsH-like family protein [Caldisericia bacterium]HPA65216.1 DsrE/DsrF/DrsH-like family protein [Caldisericia bacterium]
MAEKATIVVFSGDLDKVLAAFVIATGCAAQGMEVTMFYTFWGLNVVKKDKGPIAGAKNWMQKMMGMMNRGGISRLPLSKFNMAGMGRSMMKKLMKKTNVAPLSEMLAMARDLDVKMWACKMSMDVMGVAKEDLIPEVDKIVGVAAYAAEAQQSKINLFI